MRLTGFPRVDSSHPSDVLSPNSRNMASGKFGSDPWTPARYGLVCLSVSRPYGGVIDIQTDFIKVDQTDLADRWKVFTFPIHVGAQFDSQRYRPLVSGEAVARTVKGSIPP